MATRTTHQKSRPSLVPPPVAGVASLDLPDLGQVLALKVQRGLLLLGSVATSIGLFAWRVNLLAPQEVGAIAKLTRAIDRRPGFAVSTLVALAAVWLWTAWDAYQQAQPGQRGGIGVFALVLVVFFALGWQISEINLIKAVTELSDAWRPLSRVIWPWAAAVERDTETVSAGADILSPCDDEPPPPPPEEVPGEPYLVADPTCGDLATRDESLKEVLGTTLTLVGGTRC